VKGSRIQENVLKSREVDIMLEKQEKVGKSGSLPEKPGELVGLPWHSDKIH